MALLEIHGRLFCFRKLPILVIFSKDTLTEYVEWCVLQNACQSCSLNGIVEFFCILSGFLFSSPVSSKSGVWRSSARTVFFAFLFILQCYRIDFIEFLISVGGLNQFFRVTLFSEC